MDISGLNAVERANNPNSILSVCHTNTQKTEQPSAVQDDTFIPQNNGKLELRAEVEKLMNKSVQCQSPIETVQYADSKGRVKHLAIMLSPTYRGEVRDQLLQSYKTMFQHMEPDTKFTVLCGSQFDKSDIEDVIKENNIPNPDRFHFVNVGTGATIWARDMLVSSFNPESGKSYMINSSHIHSRDGNVPPIITQKDPSVGVINTRILVTDGGDTVATEKDSFVGYDSIHRTTSYLKWLASDSEEFGQWAVKYYSNVMGKQAPEKKEIKDEDLSIFEKMMKKFSGKTYFITDDGQMFEDLAVKLFEEYMGKPVTPVGNDDPTTPVKEKPVVFHQDMCMTPVDEKTFFLADPTLFEEIYNSLSPEERQKANEQFKEVSGFSFFSGSLDSFIRNTESSNNLDDITAYEKTLKEKGYDVVRIPYRYTQSLTKPSFTYNNCLMERFEKDGKEVRRVFLPIVGVDAFDNYAAKKYEEQGYEVFPIRMNEVIKMQGALRCVTNWLERSEKA